ncbi:MAG: hypothetical protein IH965_05255 [Gemmatimonadetes bacterium]|nr:hypothetical protein [Gemmatimonadota bacterium]
MVPTANRSSSKRYVHAPTRSPARADEPRRPTSLAPVINQLAGLDGGEHWVVSCYLKLEPRDRSRGKYLIKLKNRIKQRLAAFDEVRPERAARKAVQRDVNRIREYLEQPGNLPPGRGIAIFASEPLDLFLAIPLAMVFRSRLAVARSPLVRELAALDDEFGRVICAVCDRTTARFFDVSAGEVVELPGLTAADTTRAGRFHGSSESRTHRNRSEPRGRGVGGSALGEHKFNQRIREEKHRHYAQIAQRLFTLSREAGVVGVVLAGTGADVAVVEPHLHPYVRDAVLGEAKLNPKSASPHDVLEAVLSVRQQKERAWEARHIDELREGLGSRWAVNGIAPTLDALSRGQVRTLLVDPNIELPGYRCAETGRLAHTPEACDGQGPAEPIADVIDDAIEETLRQGSHVDVIEDPVLRNHVDGLAALLRFKLS